MTRIYSFLFAILIVISISSSHASANKTLSAKSREILELGQNLGIEGQAEVAQKKILKSPRPKIVTAILDGLRAGGEWAIAAGRVATSIAVKEVVPELEKSIEREPNNWQVILAVNALANDEQKKSIAPLWLKKMPSFSNPTKVAVIESLARWSYPFSNSEFESGVKDASFDVRLAIVRQFFVTRYLLSVEQQTARYRTIFSLQPYQARLEGMIEFQLLSEKDHAALKKAVDEPFAKACKSEKNSEVKIECEKLLKETK